MVFFISGVQPNCKSLVNVPKESIQGNRNVGHAVFFAPNILEALWVA